MKTQRCLGFAVFWIALNLIAPQIPVNDALRQEGSQGPHPFYRWNLFSGDSKQIHRSGIEADQCQNHFGPQPFNPLAQIIQHPENRWRTKQRINDIGRYFEAGKKEVARDALRLVVEHSLPNLITEKCHLRLYWFDHYGFGEKPRTFVEGSEIAF